MAFTDTLMRINIIRDAYLSKRSDNPAIDSTIPTRDIVPAIPNDSQYPNASLGNGGGVKKCNNLLDPKNKRNRANKIRITKKSFDFIMLTVLVVVKKRNSNLVTLRKICRK